MNFIDEALQKHLSADEFLQAMGAINEHPEVRGLLTGYPQWIQDVIAVLDYDTEMTGEGLENREYTPEIEALTRCGIMQEAELLSCVHEYSEYAALAAIYPRLAFMNEKDYGVFWDSLKAYIEKNLS